VIDGRFLLGQPSLSAAASPTPAPIPADWRNDIDYDALIHNREEPAPLTLPGPASTKCRGAPQFRQNFLLDSLPHSLKTQS
jgi:hypothetical protein